MVPKNPNFIIVPMLSKNFFLLMLYPEGKMIRGSIRSKNNFSSKFKSYINCFSSSTFPIECSKYETKMPSMTTIPVVWPILGLNFSIADSIMKNSARNRRRAAKKIY